MRTKFLFPGFLLLAATAFSGLASAQQLNYQLDSNPATVFVPGSTITLPTTNVGDTSTLVIRVSNPTIVNGTVTSIGATGTGFTITQAPPLPATVPPAGSFVFTIQFAPTKAGPSTGSLVIINPNTNSSDIFTLSGVGLGSQLTNSYTSGNTTITLSTTNTSVIFSPVPVTQSATVVFTITNNGTLPAVVSNIGIGQSASPFLVTGLPPLPATIAPGASIKFNIIATPTTIGFINGTLQIDSTVVPLVASGTTPPPVSGYTIGGISGGTVAPKTQPKISLTLGSAYPVALNGVLTLNISGSLPADPAVQFATGGRTVPFSIPANTTSAIFGSSGTSVAIQTGTVADTLTFSPTFSTLQGQIDLTPANPSALQVAVAPAVPSLVGIQLTAQTVDGFSILVTGYSTTRTLTNFNVQFTMAAGYTMPQTSFTLSLQQTAAIWFQSTTSQAFGGQFLITFPFGFQGLPTNTPIQRAFKSVSVSVSNELGASNTVQTNLQ